MLRSARMRARGRTKATCAAGFYAAYDAEGCEYIPLADPEIDRRLKEGPDLVSANFVIPYPPGFPIMVPGQVITQETIDFMRKLDVKEIHGYEAAKGLKLVPSHEARREACGSARQETSRVNRSRRRDSQDDDRSIVGSAPDGGLFRVPAEQSLPAAVPHGRTGGLDRPGQHQGLRPRHGRGRDRGGRRRSRSGPRPTAPSSS